MLIENYNKMNKKDEFYNYLLIYYDFYIIRIFIQLSPFFFFQYNYHFVDIVDVVN